ncbi:APC family permease [Novipirellula artificiosorum]|uniref:Serine/threonine exchanger SteT n=1 Tax=Novipirellula artificiosorum TaxID=2528016 RepID=A0A5C6D1G4_9BACT|nr:APC family permease [Novipirellula artificiosorum]TWU30568.1 Serine/threonine exchanger SteT [Novipirellula artificiosorum]
MSKQDASSESNKHVNASHPPLDLLSATSLVAASMIGAGVYTTSGFTLADLGSPGWVVTAWVVAGVIAICGAICYGALARELTESGGEYMFLSRAFHPIAGLMAGWVSLLAGFTSAIAFAATTFEAYLEPVLDWPGGVVASIVVLLAALLHTIGVRPGARIQDAVVLLKFALIGAFVVIAIRSIAIGSLEGDSLIVSNETTQSTSFDNPSFAFALSFATALMWISLSYSGFNAATYVAGEVKDAKRNVPRAMLFGTLLVTVCYVALNAIFVYGAPQDTVVGQPDIAAKAAEAIGGPSFTLFVRVVILFGLFTSVSAMVMTGPRVYAKMAEDGFLPSWFRLAGRPPIAAIWAQVVMSIVVINISSLEELLKYLAFTLSVSAALTASLLFWARGKDGKRISVPAYPVPPVVFVGGTLLAAILSAIHSPVQAVVGIATIAFGAMLYPWYKRRQRLMH